MQRIMPNIWSYGVTTVPSRAGGTLPQTLESLRQGGFPKPHLFVDNHPTADGKWWTNQFGLDVTIRGGDAVRTFGHWCLSLIELYIRNPDATRFAMFQDDFVTYRNLRGYLDKCTLPNLAYWNLYTHTSNTPDELKRNGYPTPSWYPAEPKTRGWYPSNQAGRGGVALVFNRDTVLQLLQSKHMTERPMTAGIRRWKYFDGGVIQSLSKLGYKEYVHSPSLVLHTGKVSTMGNRPHPDGAGFLGEGYNALDLLS